MPLRTALFLIPALLLAQAPATDAPKAPEPPAEVDQALRARAKEFLQYSTEGNFRKAFEMVAEDSKDFYFGMAKPKYDGYEMTSVDYSDNFTKAVVRGNAKRTVTFAGKEIQIPMPTADNWKLEDGKWMWTEPQTKTIATPVGDLPIEPGAGRGKDPGGTTEAVPLPKDMSPEAALAAAKQLQVPTAVDKEVLEFTSGVAASQEIVFHNGLNGPIRVLATPLFDGGAFQIEPSTANVGGLKDQKFAVRYNPSAGTPTRGALLRLTVEPFFQEYAVKLKVVQPAAK